MGRPFAGWALAALLAAATTAQTGSLHPHVDLSVVLVGCTGCHRGHGASGSPMLPGPQVDVCLSCHDTQARLDEQISLGVLAAGAQPPFLSSVLNKPFTHPLDRRAFSRATPVTCTSCHAPHRSTSAVLGDGRQGPRPSPRDPNRLEYELCESCHGGVGNRRQGPSDVGGLFHPLNPSYHPVEAPAIGPSPSVPPELSGRQINCTDCHGNSDFTGPRGPHGSDVPYLLRQDYTTVDGAPASTATYALCFDCHLEGIVLAEESVFPLHAEHVIEQRTSCATCHDPHGSESNRALIRFGQGEFFSGVSPSASGVLSFVSNVPGEGQCYLTCHGRNHDPESYGITAGDELLPRLSPRR